MDCPSQLRDVTFAACAIARRTARTVPTGRRRIRQRLSLTCPVHRTADTVDKTPPELNLDMRSKPMGASCSPSGPAIRHRSEQPEMLGLAESTDGSRSVAPPRETRTSLVTGGLESAVVWMPASAGKLIARVEVQDAAHNVASQEKSAPAHLAAESTTRRQQCARKGS